MSAKEEVLLGEIDALARSCRERAETEALIVDVLTPNDGLVASDALRAYLRERVGAWRLAARGLQFGIDFVAGQPHAYGLEGVLDGLLRLLRRGRERGSEAVRAVYDTLIPPITAYHERAAREVDHRLKGLVREIEEQQRGEEWKGDAWTSPDAP